MRRRHRSTAASGLPERSWWQRPSSAGFRGTAAIRPPRPGAPQEKGDRRIYSGFEINASDPFFFFSLGNREKLVPVGHEQGSVGWDRRGVDVAPHAVRGNQLLLFARFKDQYIAVFV